jgi:hypothetical protein
MTPLDRLEQLARAATPGPWKMDGRLIIDANTDAVAMVNIARTVEDGHADSTYIAACSPERILRLCACIKAADAMRADDECVTTIMRNYDAARAALDYE